MRKGGPQLDRKHGVGPSMEEGLLDTEDARCSNAHCVDGMIVIGFPKDQQFPCPTCNKEDEDEPEKIV